MQLCTNSKNEQLVVNQFRKGLDIVNDDLLMLPPRVTGVDPSLAMVEEARFLSLRSILTMRIIMMKIMLKKLKSLQCCVWYVHNVISMVRKSFPLAGLQFQTGGAEDLPQANNSAQVHRYHRHRYLHRSITCPPATWFSYLFFVGRRKLPSP